MDGKDGDHRRINRRAVSKQDYSLVAAPCNNSTILDYSVAVCVGCKRPDNHCHLCKKKLPSGRVLADLSDSVDRLVLFG
jgi:hypothetical protein